MKREIEYIEITELIPYANNSRTHNKEQIKQIADSITEFGFTNPVLIDKDNGIIAGHGRVLGADKVGMDKIPCIRLSYLTDDQKRAYIIADNKLALNAGWDDEKLRAEIEDLLESNYDVSLLGFDDKEFGKLMGEMEENPYTKKVATPVYEVTGEIPKLNELVDETKTKYLLDLIEASNVAEHDKEFLRKAAYRHLRFNYSNIAEYYAGADEEMQELMEKSALVIIDYDKAIEYGYVELSKAIEDLMAKDSEG